MFTPCWDLVFSLENTEQCLKFFKALFFLFLLEHIIYLFIHSHFIHMYNNYKYIWYIIYRILTYPNPLYLLLLNPIFLWNLLFFCIFHWLTFIFKRCQCKYPCYVLLILKAWITCNFWLPAETKCEASYDAHLFTWA